MHKGLIHILLVEDDPGDCRLVKLTLAKVKQPVEFAVQTAGSLAECLERLKNNSFDLVLLDLGLPDSQGLATVDRVCEVCPDISVVVLTCLADEEMGVEALKRGAGDYLVKNKVFKDLLVRTIRYSLERKKAEEAIAKLAKFPSENPNPVLRLAKDSTIIYANEAGLPLLTAWGTGVGEYLPDEWRKFTADVFNSGSSKDAEFEYDGHILSLTFAPVTDSNYVNVYGLDITERKLTQERQDQLLEEVENANRELKDFAYIVSHDLKAPLRGISTLAEWISTDYADKLDEDGKEQMDLLMARTERMHNLIDGILQYSRVGRIREEQVSVNLNELVPEVIEMLEPPENIKMEIENELPTVLCEQTRIMQVFQNLLSNAVKYMDKPRGQIKVGCVTDNGYWKFSVSDNGPGIEEKDFEKIFQIFQTLVPRDEFESTGIGLTLIKKIVESYDGKIWVESKPGEGSTFFFTLPKQKSEVVDNEKLKTGTAC